MNYIYGKDRKQMEIGCLEDSIEKDNEVRVINRSVETIVKGNDRILLVMATGTGKIFTAFQIVYRLFKTGQKRRILYLSDRNILIDQTIIGDFKPLTENINKIKKRNADKDFDGDPVKIKESILLHFLTYKFS